MAYVPEIVDYKPFYIQTDADATAIDTRSWGMVAKSNPFPLLPTPKEPYNNDWKDEDGVDEYNAVMHYKAIEFEVDFYVKTIGPLPHSMAMLRGQISSFFNRISKGEFKIYDSYTGIGRRRVRYAGYTEKEFKSTDKWSRAIFTVKFKVNDPITLVGFDGEGGII